VPNLDFYAIEDDQKAVLDVVFDLVVFRVFEAYSEPDSQLREFRSADEIPEDPRGAHVMLYAAGSGPEPLSQRIDLRPDALGNAKFRYRCQGWGLIQLHFGTRLGDGELRWSHTNHNTGARAAKWAGTLPELGDPTVWDWVSVRKASDQLNRNIRTLAITKIGSHPVLPRAAELIGREGFRFEYGTGIHAQPSPGMRGTPSETH
jgi:hypothetical protein